MDIAVDPLEGTTLCAKDMPGAIATMAMAEGGTLLNAPDTSIMEKIAIGPELQGGVVDLVRPRRDLAAWQGQRREAGEHHGAHPRPAAPCGSIAAVRKSGAAVRLITDGDVAEVIHTANVHATGIDIYIGIGGAPEGVLAYGAALHRRADECRLVLDTEEKRSRAAKMGIKDPRKKYQIEDMVKATACSPRPGSPTATCSRACASTAT